MSKQKIIIITGLTGSGKSSLAIDIAKVFPCEIISADSVQIYRKLDIGSAKETQDNMSIIKHHLIDIKNFDETYNVGEFISDCKNAIYETITNGHIPIIVGGTAMYIKALLEGYSLGGTTGNDEFRKKYKDMAKESGNNAVWEELNVLNPEKAKLVHPNNLKRVIRYLEIEKFGVQDAKQESILKDYDVLAIGVVADRAVIYDKINKRVDEMISSGLEDEVRELVSLGANRSTQSTNSIGYKEWFDYYDGITTKEQTIELIKQHTRNYCKRQLTFLKTIKGLMLCTKSEAGEKIREFLND